MRINNKLASGLASFVREHNCSTHRGWAELDDVHPECVVIFGNDGHADPRTQEEIRLIRQHLECCEWQEMGFGVCDEGYTWAIVGTLAEDDRNGLKRAITEAADLAGFGNAFLQSALAR